MKRINMRDWFGLGLVGLGVLMLLDNLNIIKGATGLFFGVLLLLVASFFFGGFARNPRAGWWNIIPAMALLGLGLESLLPVVLPKSLQFISGNMFLICLGLSFWLVYFADRARWWGIIPGGVLLTLVAVNIAGNADNPAMLMLGLGITFLLVAVLPAAGGRNEWAYVPSLVLMGLGAFLLSDLSMDKASVYLPWVLIGLGGLVIVRFMMGNKS